MPIGPGAVPLPGGVRCRHRLAAPDRAGTAARLAGGLDGAEQAMSLVVNAGAEQQGGRVARDAVAEAQPPQALDLDRAAVLVPQSTPECAGHRVVRVDAAVAEVPHQQVTAEAAEPAGRRLRQPPRGVQLATADQAAQQVTAGAVDVDEAAARAGDLVLAVGVLLGVGDIQPPTELLDVEGRIAAWELVVAEPARQVDPAEALVEDVDASVVEVGGVQEAAGRGGGKRQALVDGMTYTSADLRLGRRRRRGHARVPAGDQPGLGAEQEQGRPAGVAGVDFEPGCRVEHLPGGGAAGDADDQRAFWMGLPLTKPG